MQFQYDISIVVVNRNGAKFLRRLLDSLLESLFQGQVTSEIIVVDNASTDESLDVIKEYMDRYKFIKLIKLRHNVGYCLAANLGVLKSQSKFVAILNPDLYCDPYWLIPIIAKIKQSGDDLRIGVIQPLIFDYYDNTRLQSNGLFCDMVCNYKSNIWNSKVITAAFGAAIIVNRSAFLKIGGLDPAYFMYGDEVDLGIRMWLAGYIVLLEPLSKVYHYGGGVTPQKPFINYLKRYLSRRNQLITIAKSFSLRNVIISFIILFLINMIRLIKNRSDVYSIINAYKYFVENLKYIIMKRRSYIKVKVINERKLRKYGILRPLLE